VYVTGAAGQDLRYLANQRYYAPQTSVPNFRPTSGYYLETRIVPLKDLFQDVDRLERVRGTLRLLLPTHVADLTFRDLRPGATQKTEGWGVTLLRMEASGLPEVADAPPAGGALGRAHVLEFALRGTEGTKLSWLVLDRHGQVLADDAEQTPPLGSMRLAAAQGLGADRRRFVRSPASGTLRLAVPGEPASARFKIISCKEITYRFEFRGVPLRKLVPKQVEPVQFPGHAAPVTVSVQKWQRLQTTANAGTGGIMNSSRPAGATGQITLRIVNHSQKDIERLHFRFAYLDSAGRVLGRASRTWFQPIDAEGTNRAVSGPLLPITPDAPVGRDLEVQTPSLPEPTETITVELTEVGFLDATTWSPK
jgi:hypothetical protein